MAHRKNTDLSEENSHFDLSNKFDSLTIGAITTLIGLALYLVYLLWQWAVQKWSKPRYFTILPKNHPFLMSNIAQNGSQSPSPNSPPAETSLNEHIADVDQGISRVESSWSEFEQNNHEKSDQKIDPTNPHFDSFLLTFVSFSRRY